MDDHLRTDDLYSFFFSALGENNLKSTEVNRATF